MAAELFMSDIHGEYESFAHVLRSGCGAVERTIKDTFPEFSEKDKTTLLMFVCYPRTMTERHLRNGYALDKAEMALHAMLGMLMSRAEESTSAAAFRHALGQEGLPETTRHDELAEIDQETRIALLAHAIRNMSVNKVHLVGDIYDRGPAPDLIMDELARVVDYDIQWGNHDIVWMGAALGQPGCIAHVMRICSRYSNLPILTERYHMDLGPVEEFACRVYADDPCAAFGLKGNAVVTPEQRQVNVKIQKAMTMIQFKVEGQLIDENPGFGLADRKLLHHIDYERGTVVIDGVEHELLDKVFPTVDPADPYRLTDEEAEILAYLQKTFRECEQLQRHISLFLDHGGLYAISGNALMFHACVPLNPDGSLMEVELFGKTLKGKALFDEIDQHVRDAFEASDAAQAKLGQDLLWYLWLGAGSPLFGKDKMATFERYLVESKEAQAEHKNAFYKLQDDETAHDAIFKDFGMDPASSYLVCGHVPVKIKDGENPVRCKGRHFNIDGGFSEAYQPTTGIAGLTLVSDEDGLSLVEHQPFHRASAIEENRDIVSHIRKVIADK